MWRSGATDALARGGAIFGLVLCLGVVTYVSAAPLRGSDLWWHMAMGRVYADAGPWPDGEPLLFTAHEDAPVQHEWLFGVALYGAERATGFTGLRVLHALAAAGILALAFSIFRKESGSLVAASLATALFALLSVWRLAQLRPDLVSIPAALLVYRWLLQRERPPGREPLGAALLLLALWANAHSLFAVGLALLVAALLGLGLGELLRRVAQAGGSAGVGAAFARRLGLALGLGVLVTALNPRGFSQHATFFSSSRDTAIWRVKDEWTHFDPLTYSPDYGAAVSAASFAVSDAVLLLFIASAFYGLIRLWRRPSPAHLDAAAPVLIGLGAAGIAALLVSIRFQWMLFFPLLLPLRALRFARERGARPAGWAAQGLSAAAIGVGLLLAFGETAPSSPPLARYLVAPYEASRFAVGGVRFLRDSGLEGRLFNSYPMGGYLGYWLAPRLRTFIDGRTEHYPPRVFDEYLAINVLQGTHPGESSDDLLRQRRVDLFFGVGLPIERLRGDLSVYTSMNLAQQRGWTLIYRAIDCAIYLRNDERNRDNLARVARYYHDAGVPFDPEFGLEVSRVIESRPDWAISHRLVPVNHQRLQAMRGNAKRGVRTRALDELALSRALIGDFEAQIELDRELAALRPGNPTPLRRLVFGMLGEGRPEEALRAARQLMSVAPNDPRSRRFLRAAQDAIRASEGSGRGKPALPEMIHLPLLTRAEAERQLQGRFAPPQLL